MSRTFETQHEFSESFSTKNLPRSETVGDIMPWLDWQREKYITISDWWR